MYPDLIHLSFLAIKTQWVFLVLGIIFASALLLKSCKRKKIAIDIIDKNFLLLTIITLLGSRIGFLINDHLLYETKIIPKDILQIVYFWNQNWSLWSGVVSFLTALLILIVLTQKENVKKWLDVLTLPILLLLFFSHFGDFVEGTNYGKPSNVPWAITFKNFSVMYTVPIHPTQLYAALYTLGTIIILKNYNHFLEIIIPDDDGSMALRATMLYSFFKFLEEFLRGDDVIRIFDLRLLQIISLLIFIGSIILMLYWKKHKANNI